MTKRNSSQFLLLFESRFGPFFLTQFLGALNDNLYKNALLAAVTYGSLKSSLALHSFNNLSALLFILPFFLFSAWAGQLADHREKSALIRHIKKLEILIMALAAVALLLDMAWILLLLLFLMGTQSALFGPVKYSIIPQHLSSDELVAGNGLVETGTFLAILLGTIAAGVISQWPAGNTWFALLFFVLALLGYGTSRKIPVAPATAPEMPIRFQPLRETWRTLVESHQDPRIFVLLLGISWFWFLGAAYLTQIYGFAKDSLNGDQTLVIALLTLFSIGISLGSLSCRPLAQILSPPRIVLLGGLGISLFGADIYFSVAHLAEHSQLLWGLSEFISLAGAKRILFDFMLVGFCGGLYIVPLYTMIQRRAAPNRRSRTIAAVNIVNALFMVLSAASGLLLLGVLQYSVTEFFLILALANLAMLALLAWRRLFVVYTDC